MIGDDMVRRRCGEEILSRLRDIYRMESPDDQLRWEDDGGVLYPDPMPQKEKAPTFR